MAKTQKLTKSDLKRGALLRDKVQGGVYRVGHVNGSMVSLGRAVIPDFIVIDSFELIETDDDDFVPIAGGKYKYVKTGKTHTLDRKCVVYIDDDTRRLELYIMSCEDRQWLVEPEKFLVNYEIEES